MFTNVVSLFAKQKGVKGQYRVGIEEHREAGEPFILHPVKGLSSTWLSVSAEELRDHTRWELHPVFKLTGNASFAEKECTSVRIQLRQAEDKANDYEQWADECQAQGLIAKANALRQIARTFHATVAKLEARSLELVEIR